MSRNQCIKAETPLTATVRGSYMTIVSDGITKRNYS